jgi:hypothetical protein
VPDVFRNVHGLRDFDKTVEEAIARIEMQHRPFTEDEHRSLRHPATKKRIKQGATVEALADPGPQVQTALSQKGLAIVVIQKPKRSFVIGSNPVLRFMPAGSNLADPNIQVWLPVAHDVMVGPAPIPPQEERVIGLSKGSDIRHVNRAIFRQSTAIAGHSRALIASLAGIPLIAAGDRLHVPLKEIYVMPRPD